MVNEGTLHTPFPCSEQGMDIRRAAWRSYLRVGLGLFLFSVIPQILALLCSATLPTLAPALCAHPLYPWVLQVVLMYGIAFPIAYAVIGRPNLSFPNEKSHPSFLLLFTVFCLLSAVSRIGAIIGEVLMRIVEAISGIPQSNPLDTMLDGTPMWVIFAVVVVIGPLVEELIFRHAVMRRLLPFGETGAILFSGVAFGLMHGNFYQLFYTVGMGMLIGYLYARTRKLLYPILLHAVYNFMGSVIPLSLMDSLGELLTHIEAGTATPELLIANFLPLCGLLAYAFLTFGLAAAGIVLFIVFFRRIRLAPATHPLRAGEHARACFANVGVILFAVAMLAELILSLLPL